MANNQIFQPGITWMGCRWQNWMIAGFFFRVRGRHPCLSKGEKFTTKAIFGENFLWMLFYIISYLCDPHYTLLYMYYQLYRYLCYWPWKWWLLENIFGQGENACIQQFLLLLQCFLLYLNPFLNKPWFLHVCSISLLKTPWENEKLLVTSNFSFSLSVFYPFG